MSHVTHTNVSHECVTHTNKRRHAHTPESCQNTNESRHTPNYRFAVMGHVTHTNTARHTHERVTHERVMAHTRMSHVTHTNQSRHVGPATPNEVNKSTFSGLASKCDMTR